MWYQKLCHDFNQQGTYTIHAVIKRKYKKCPSTTILKHANVLAEVSKSPYVILSNMTPYKIYTVLLSTYAQWPNQ